MYQKYFKNTLHAIINIKSIQYNLHYITVWMVTIFRINADSGRTKCSNTMKENKSKNKKCLETRSARQLIKKAGFKTTISPKGKMLDHHSKCNTKRFSKTLRVFSATKLPIDIVNLKNNKFK